MRELFGTSIIAKLSSSWQVKVQLHLNWDSLIINDGHLYFFPPIPPPSQVPSNFPLTTFTKPQLLCQFHFCFLVWTISGVRFHILMIKVWIMINGINTEKYNSSSLYYFWVLPSVFFLLFLRKTKWLSHSKKLLFCFQ